MHFSPSIPPSICFNNNRLPYNYFFQRIEFKLKILKVQIRWPHCLAIFDELRIDGFFKNSKWRPPIRSNLIIRVINRLSQISNKRERKTLLLNYDVSDHFFFFFIFKLQPYFKSVIIVILVDHYKLL